MQNLINNAGKRRMSALVRKTNAGFQFSLQSRAVSKEDETTLSQNPTPLPIKGNMTVAIAIGLQYCPFCGTNLQKLVTPLTRERFEILAEEQAKVDNRWY